MAPISTYLCESQRIQCTFSTSLYPSPPASFSTIPCTALTLMETNGVVFFHNRRSPSSDRFLDVFSPPNSGSSASAGGGFSLTGDELNEAEVFWTGDFTEPNSRSTSPTFKSQYHSRQSFIEPENFGILAALPEHHRKPNRPVLYRKPSITPSSRLFPAIPKPPPQEREYSQSVRARKIQQSAPVRVPIMQKKVRNVVELDDEDDEEMLPPHEIVARGSARSPKTTFSVLEGAGRTLKGRDLRQVRNAVWHTTDSLPSTNLSHTCTWARTPVRTDTQTACTHACCECKQHDPDFKHLVLGKSGSHTVGLGLNPIFVRGGRFMERVSVAYTILSCSSKK
ncbi:hypothetical protein LOK49_LG05G01018 [Camellia lanceoleosa]|uniref:Uncharacterized protein n=1 Tax=Camellia lanceoleosa TaxID=1840588 RepID=A0ACC0HJ92_9ERIC|nr:hypothetical protein LOK49_LG05G01018 [Camellia lanceoleosa]